MAYYGVTDAGISATNPNANFQTTGVNTPTTSSIAFGANNTPALPTTLNSSNMASASPIQLPTKAPDNTNYAGILANAQAQATSIQAGITGLTTPPAPATPTPTPAPAATDTSSWDAILNKIKSYMPTAPASSSDAYASAEQSAGINGLQNNVNTNSAAVLAAQNKLAVLNAKLNGITAEGTTQNLALQNQGGAITSSGVANASQANVREAAIKAIPVQVEILGAQAEASLAQGNEQLSQQILSQAQDHLDKSFQLQQQDTENTYKYQTDLYNSLLDTATKEQAQQIDDKKTALATNQSNLSDARNFAQSLSSTALSNGQASIAAQLASIQPPDVNSATFATDLQAYNQKVATLQGKISSGNSLDDQYKQLQIQKLQQDIKSANASGSPTVPLVNNNGQTVTVPTVAAPYYNVSDSGVGYIDASTLQGTAAEKTNIINQAQAAGLKVITNKNSAADLVNISDANAKLDDISTIMTGIGQPGWVSRTLGGLGLTALATATQSDPQKAAAGALQSVGLDILKAISGIQGFRGNSSVVAQVTDHLPKITDTVDTINQKVAYIRTLISDREDAIVGKPPASASTNQVVNGVTYTKGSDGLYYPKQ